MFNNEFINQLDLCRNEQRCYAIEPNNTAPHDVMVHSLQTQGINFFQCGRHGLEAEDISIIANLEEGEWWEFPHYTVERIPNDNF